MTALRAYLEKKPLDRFSRYALALELKRGGDVAGAEQELLRLLSDHPSSGAGWLQLGNLRLEQGREDDAAQAWRDGLAALQGLTDADSTKSRGEIAAALATVE